VRRFAALSYEGLLLAAVVLLAGFPHAAGDARRRPEAPSRCRRCPLASFSFCLIFGLAGLYFIWCWSGGAGRCR
jgi:hypothetical protein